MHFWPFIGVTSPDINSRGPPCTTGMWCLSSGPELCSHQWLELYQWNSFSGKLPRLTSKTCGILKPSGRLKRCIYIWMFPKIGGTPKSSMLIRFSIISHPFWDTLIFGNTHVHTQQVDVVFGFLKPSTYQKSMQAGT